MPGTNQQTYPANPDGYRPDARYFDHEMLARKNAVLHLIQMARHVILLEGVPESGRTAFLSALMDERDGLIMPLWVSEDDSAEPELLAQALIQGFRFPPSPVAAGPRVIEHANEQLNALLLAGHRPVLLVDDADALLGDAVLNLLLFRQGSRIQDGPTAMTLVMTAAPGFAQQLRKHQMLVDDVHVVQLPAWREDQVAVYLQQQRKAAGIGSVDTADLDAAHVHRQSCGLPGRVLAACQQQTLESLAAVPFAAPDASERQRWLRITAISCGLLIAAGLAGWMLLGHLPGSNDQVAVDDGESHTRISEPAHDPQPQPLPADVRDSAEQEPELLTDDPGQGDIAGLLPDILSPDADGVLPMLTESLQSSDVVVIQQGASERQQSPVEEPVAEPAAESPEAEAAGEGLEPLPGADARVVEQTPGQPPLQQTPSPVSDRQWLASRNPRHYTIQLLGAHSRTASMEFVREFEVLQPRLIETTRQGRTWYVVVTGSYPSRQSAQEGLSALPQSLQHHGPWLRSFASLQAP